MMYRATRTFGKYRAGEVYSIERPRLEDRSAIRTGLLVAANGWCAPSDYVFSKVNALGEQLLDLPSIQTVRGGIRFPDTEQPAEKPKKARKKPAIPLTLEEIAKASGEAMDGLRG